MTPWRHGGVSPFSTPVLVKSSESVPLKEYVGYIWIDGQPGIRLRVEARTAEEAKAAVEAEYGRGHTISLWNEDDASRPR